MPTDPFATAAPYTDEQVLDAIRGTYREDTTAATVHTDYDHRVTPSALGLSSDSVESSEG